MLALSLRWTGRLVQAQDTGLISGIVVDEPGAGIANATVTNTNKATGAARAANAHAERFYRAPAQPAGTDEVRIELYGFRTTIPGAGSRR